ncbi:MAG: corrinoid protein [Candidatus Bathyarchaeia archaeon]
MVTRMKEQQILDRLRDCIVNMDIDGVREASEQALNAKISAITAINEGMLPGIRIVGEKFQAGEFFLTELIVVGAAMEEGLKILGPHVKKNETTKLGTVVMGTVEGDLHSIGKDIVRMWLQGSGFNVVDLGVDIPADQFIETVRAQKPIILGLSSLLTSTMPEMGNVIARLASAGLRHQVKVIVGGAPVSKAFAEKIGADAYAAEAVAGLNTCKEWAGRGHPE